MKAPLSRRLSTLEALLGEFVAEGDSLSEFYIRNHGTKTLGVSLPKFSGNNT